jgi:hypothetical protein
VPENDALLTEFNADKNEKQPSFAGRLLIFRSEKDLFLL